MHGVATSAERTARELLGLASVGIRAAAHSEDGDEAAREVALEDLRDRAEQARKIFGEDTEVSVRELSVPTYDSNLPERRAAIVGRLPVQDGSPAQARQDAYFVLSELRRHYASASAHRRARGSRPGFKAYFDLASPEAESGVAGGYAELGYIPAEDRFLLRLHNGFEDELSATTEEHVAELVGEAAPVTVYIESFSQG